MRMRSSSPRLAAGLFAALLVSLVVHGCGRAPRDGDETAVRKGTRIGSYLVVDVNNGGSISGKVTLEGDIAARLGEIPARHVTNGQTECCKGTTEKPQQKLVTKGGGLKDVVVSLVRCDSGKAPVFGKAELDQVYCDFVPHVVPVMAGDSVALLNNDPIVHAVHGYRGIKTVFNIATSQQGGKWFAHCPDTGVTRCLCDAGHVWMEAFIHVLPNPYFAVTGEDGAFSIDNIPPGTYTVRFSHELWEDVERTITVPAGGKAAGDIVLNVKDATKIQ